MNVDKGGKLIKNRGLVHLLILEGQQQVLGKAAARGIMVGNISTGTSDRGLGD